MTAAHLYKFSSKQNKNASNKISNLKKEIFSILKKYTPRYLKILPILPEEMYLYLKDTLKYWYLKIKSTYFDKKLFKIFKIIEIISFWSGYLNAGGKLPLEIIKTGSGTIKINKINKSESNGHNDKKFDSSIFVVIPIGNISLVTCKILINQLKILKNINAVSKIYLGFDGIQNPKLMKEINKISPKISTYYIANRQGPAKIRNIGIKNGLEDGFSNVLLLDYDVIFNKVMINNLINEINTNQYHIACPLIFSYGIENINFYHDINGTLNGRYLSNKEKDSLLFGTTSCMFINRVVFDQDIFFSPIFNKAAGEDISFSIDAIKSGFRIFPLNHIKIMHWYGYENNLKNNLKKLGIRFERYGAGEVNILKKHRDFYNLLEKSVERPCFSINDCKKNYKIG
ncbi:MAG: glycosyltransferase [Candidatus Helarchaeota archaeon]